MLSKGKIIRVGKANVTEQLVTNVSLLVTSEMLPAFRFVAYSFLRLHYSPEVLTDSVSVKVEARCLGSVSGFTKYNMVFLRS